MSAALKATGRVVATPGRLRLPGIEGLRAVAAGAVVVHHVWLVQGPEGVGADGVFLNLALGVTLFFTLSGFLLYRPFARAIADGQRLPGIRDYLRNRALRILPAYWLVLLVSALVLRSANVRGPGGELTFGALDDPLELLAAALLVHDYNPDTMIIGVGPAWSLAVEAVFYLVLPLLAIGASVAARGTADRRRRVMVLLGPPALLLLVGLSGKAVAGVALPASPGAGYEPDWHSVVERSFWAQADLFAFGMVAAVLHGEVVDGRLRLPRGWRLGALGLAVAIFVPAAMTLEHGQLSYLPQNTVIAVSAALLVAVVALPSDSGRPHLLQRLLEMRLLVATGLISYSVFLWNEPLLRWLDARGAIASGRDSLALNLVITAVVVGAVSWASYRLVELPALRRKHRQPRVPAPMDRAQLEAAP